MPDISCKYGTTSRLIACASLGRFLGIEHCYLYNKAV